ncbi:PDZ domain (Also known as DHR or GLGF) domain-containing protein [Ditylenchus destructor]|uniref:PDZ domain (Also known as DHR or GLGF) domain-containing protein n=1 Tax=Ditylenchus destructor TaxID=166010 RepID=A0AAD4MG15_9BILA|nr:PDZ domain (Also known as DHR or GLGF) domain-containing protein [Ditylenchus destructor]
MERTEGRTSHTYYKDLYSSYSKMMETQTVTSVTSPPENNTNASAEQNIDKNSSDEYEIVDNLDQSSILSTPDTGICPKQVSISDKTPNVPSQNALLEIERLRQEFKQQIDALGQELMSKIEAKHPSLSQKKFNCCCETRTVLLNRNPNETFGIIIVGGREEVSQNGGLPGTGSNFGIFVKSVMPDSLAGRSGKMFMGDRVISVNNIDLRYATHEQAVNVIKNATNPVKFVVQSLQSFTPNQDLSDNVINLSESLSTLEASVEHCNAFAETCYKPEASAESSKNTAHDLDVTLNRQETEKQSEVHQARDFLYDFIFIRQNSNPKVSMTKYVICFNDHSLEVLAKRSLARCDVVIVKSKMSTEMQNYAIELMLESMKECTASDISKFISEKMKEKYGSEWICSISDRMPSPIVLDNQHFMSVYLNKDVELKSDDKYRKSFKNFSSAVPYRARPRAFSGVLKVCGLRNACCSSAIPYIFGRIKKKKSAAGENF